MTSPGQANRQPAGDLELWAGIEGTVNRVGDRFFDQMERSGHLHRVDDVDRIAALGVRTVRYPFLWEHADPQGEAIRTGQGWCWDFADERAARLQACGLRPIAGLLHHGSGPPGTSLLDDAFPSLFARYAAAFAQRFPWIDDYTPINEPLTTARFSGLYGLWFPHRRDDVSYLRALTNQVEGTRLALQAIRQVNPSARLVQTEDLGHTTCSEGLEDQAAFQNEHRWLTFDLLCGRVTPTHALYRWLVDVGHIPVATLARFAAEPCAPEVVGLNHYLTSDRFLDLDLSRHPSDTWGGNGRVRYADVETVTVAPVRGHQAVLREAWERYRRPTALTEVHLGCEREEQLRWLHEAWGAAQQARAEGVDVVGVTVWALLGSFDWDSLVTRQDGHYEPGAFDVRGPRPRPTALAHMTRELAVAGYSDHPVLANTGWWRRRFVVDHPRPDVGARPILITGKHGTLGAALAQACVRRGLEHRLVSRAELDITSRSDVERALEDLSPWAVVNAAGYVRVDDAEGEPERCFADNTHGAALLAAGCADRGLPFLMFSSDLVFDGAQRQPYLEEHQPAPLSIYGRSKALAEERVRKRCPRALIVRTSAFFGAHRAESFVSLVLRSLRAGRSFRAAADLTVSPTYVPALVHACLDLLIDGEEGIWHLANDGAVTWAEFARQVARLTDNDDGLIEPCASAELGLRASRPRYSVLGSSRHCLMPALESSLTAWLSTQALRALSEAAVGPEPGAEFCALKSGGQVRGPSLGCNELLNDGPGLQPSARQRRRGMAVL